MGATWLDPKVRKTALAMVTAGVPRITVCEELGVNPSTLWSWIDRHKKKQPIREVKARSCRVGDIRRTLEILDAGGSLRGTARITGHDRTTVRHWRDDPRFREATLEFDPSMSYDGTDLIDRAVVAHSLCHESSVAERFALLAAVVGFETDSEPRVRHGRGRPLENV